MSAATLSRRAARRPVSLRLRARMEAAVEQLIELLNELDGDPDAEPDLGSPEMGLTRIFQTPDKRWHQAQTTQETWARGVSDDRELDTDIEEDDTLDHGELDQSDLEPSLGWSERGESGQPVALGGNEDRELEVRIPRGPAKRAPSICNVAPIDAAGAAALGIPFVDADAALPPAENVAVRSRLMGGLEIIGPNGARYVTK